MNKYVLTPETIEQMNYSEFISLIRETNRCPGGKDTIRKIIQNSFINTNSKVLEIGSNTGFTSLEIAHSIKCDVIGIDISESCINEANRLLKQDVPDIQRCVTFKEGSAYNIPFIDNTFDLVVAGGATSFMEEKSRAISEYMRVLKSWGFLSVTQLFYKTKPPQEIVESVHVFLESELNHG
jgi:ubiquinone/menaquinone biosynthesis C-methylase UbiE